MALSATQTVYFEQRLGTPLDVPDLEERLLRLGGDGYEPAAAVEVLTIRLANLQKNPLKFSIPGDYSEDRSENAKLMQAALEDAQADAGSGPSVLVATPPQRGRWAR